MRFQKYFNTGIDDASVLEQSKHFNISPKIMEIIMSRGYFTQKDISDFLHTDELPFYDPFLLKDMDRAVARIHKAVELQETVVIFGDYDVDGISATAIMLKTLEKLGLKAFSFLPNRFTDGYGVTNDTVDKIFSLYNPSLIITVDCGISCYNEIEYAKSKNIEFIVTDHHEIPDILPDTIVVNAKIDGQTYPFKELCGTGLAFKIAQALIGEEKSNEFLPIAAIATIADIVSLTSENRLIVKKGLKLMDKYLPIGLKKLISKNKINLSKISASEIAYKIAPKINASGRMGDADDSLRLYLETDTKKIDKQIDAINEHNLKRQELSAKVYEDCKKMLATKNLSEIRSICLYSDKWDQGILGITCSKLVDEYNCPVFLFAKDGEELKGSARSLKDINIHTMLSSMKDILTTFGGHSVAAGLTLNAKYFNEFVRRINEYIFTNINDAMFTPIKYYDCAITTGEINNKLLDELELLEPCGADNAKPLFLMESKSFAISPLKTFPQHANITIDKKLTLIFFNYLEHSSKMRLFNAHCFLFEFNRSNSNAFKGNIKFYDSDHTINAKYSNIVNAIKLNQLTNIAEEKLEYTFYGEEKLIDFVANTHTSVFGTAFVCYDTSKYVSFVENYDLNGIYNFTVFAGDEGDAFNTMFVSPQTFSWAKNFKQIIFLDPVYDTKFVKEIHKISNAKIYFPIKQKYNKNVFNEINCNRSFFAQEYAKIINFENIKFYGIFDLYNLIKKTNKISFTNFYFILLVLKDLNIIKFEKIDLFLQFKIDKKIKSNLNNSALYNFCEFIKKIK